MTVAQAKRALPETTLELHEDSARMRVYTLMRGAARLMDLYVDVEEPRKNRAKIELIRVYDPACSTSERVHPGTFLSVVEMVYGRLVRLERTEMESREYAEFQKLPNWMDLQTGTGEVGIYAKGKRCATAYESRAKVESLWITQPRAVTRFFANDSECTIPVK